MTSYPIPIDGLVEAELDGVAYIRLDRPVVVAVRGEAQIVYCLAEDWPASPVAQHAARVARVVELEAELAALKAQAAPLPLLASPAQPAKKAYNRTAPPAAPIACPHCDRTLKGRAALMIHVRKRHPGQGFDLSAVATVAPVVEEPEPEPEPAPEPDPEPPANPYVACPHCITRVHQSGLAKHIAKMHGDLVITVAAVPPAEPEPLLCRHCGRECLSVAGRASHERGCDRNPSRRLVIHTEPPADPAAVRRDLTGGPDRQPAPPPTPAADAMSEQARRLRLELLNSHEDRGAFRCPACEGAAFAESLSHPGMCVRCARAHTSEAA